MDFLDFHQHFLKESFRKCWWKSRKSKNWVYVSNFNFWLKEDIRNVKNQFCRFLRNKKSLKINFTKKNHFATYIWPQKYGFRSKIMIFWKSSKNRVIGLASPKKMFENWFYSNFAFFLKTMILELHFGIFTSCVLPLLEAVEFFEPLMNTFSYSFSSPNFNTAQIVQQKHHLFKKELSSIVVPTISAF